MTWESSVVILLVGSLVAASCALLGSFLVLRRSVLLGDALSHSALPGIAIAFFLTESLSSWPMVLGAGAFGVLTVYLVEALTRSRRLREDASIGVVFPALFALGVILVSRHARQVHLDMDCVLFGEITWVPFDLLIVGEHSLGPKGLWVAAVVLLVDVAVVALFYKELKVTTFDPELAASLGISPTLVHYILMSAVSLTLVAAFEAVGAILVVALLVVPPATAYLLTERLWLMLSLAIGLGVLAACGGYAVAGALDCSIAGAIASVAGGFFVLALLFAPRGGMVAWLLSHRRLRQELSGQLLLLHLQGGESSVDLDRVAERFAWGQAELAQVLRPLEERRWVERTGRQLRLTPAGEESLKALGTAPLAHRG